MKSIKYGATMYAPATRTDLADIANGLKIPALKTVVFCTEDSISQAELPLALFNITQTLPRLEPLPIYRFIRPRNLECLKTILAMPHIERITGFVIPKADLTTLPEYLKVFESHDHFEIMPTLETKLAFDLIESLRLRDYLAQSPLASRITVLRLGALDLLGILSLRRDLTAVIYETPIGHAIDQLITVFRPANFALSAPPFEGIDHQETLLLELSLDVNRALFAKTCVHPSQVALIHEAYKAQPDELEMAKAILSPENPAVFKMDGRMCEKAVHTNWATTVLERAEVFGTKPLVRLDFYPNQELDSLKFQKY
jgi:citrate lyase beta subunit